MAKRRCRTLRTVCGALAAAGLMAASVSTVFAQTTTGVTRSALDDIVGTWQSDTVGGASARSVCAPSPQGSAVVCEQTITTPAGLQRAVNVFLVDTAAHRYVYYGLSAAGTLVRPATVSIANHVWIYGGTARDADGTYSRTVNDFTRAGVYTWRQETSTDGARWTTVRAGRVVRASQN